MQENLKTSTKNSEKSIQDMSEKLTKEINVFKHTQTELLEMKENH